MSFLSEVRLGHKFGPFVAFQAALGFIPNLLHAQTLLPRLIEAQVRLESAARFQAGRISRIQKERILLALRPIDKTRIADGQIVDLLNDYQMHRLDSGHFA